MMSRPTLRGNFCVGPTPHLGQPRRKCASYPGLNTLLLVIITTIRGHSALIPPPIRYTATALYEAKKALSHNGLNY